MSNDEVILKLKEQIEKKKAELKLSERFVPVTNCSLVHNEARYNLHVLDKESLTHMLIMLNSLRMSAIELIVLENFYLSGFHIDDWLMDIRNKLAYINRHQEAKKLKQMEARLTELLSHDKQVELEVAEIAALLSDG